MCWFTTRLAESVITTSSSFESGSAHYQAERRNYPLPSAGPTGRASGVHAAAPLANVIQRRGSWLVLTAALTMEAG